MFAGICAGVLLSILIMTPRIVQLTEATKICEVVDYKLDKVIGEDNFHACIHGCSLATENKTCWLGEPNKASTETCEKCFVICDELYPEHFATIGEKEK